VNENAAQPARRAVADLGDVYELEAPQASRARRGSVAGFSKRIVALTVTGTLAAAAVFTFAFASRGLAANASSETSEAAVPAAAASAAAEAFGDRSEQVSRDAVRENLSAAVADQTAKNREDQLDATATAVADDEAEQAEADRDELMEADLKLVAKQAKKLKKEAKEAAARLAAAQRAVGSDVDLSSLSAEEIANLTSTGGSMPVKSNYRVGAGFGATGSWSRYHTGQDFPAPTGTPIYAVASGVVLSPTNGGWAGTNVVIQHSNGGATLYAHMSKKVVSPGSTVKAGQLIGYVGTTGRSFGAHLHLEYYSPGVTPGDVYNASNPVTFLRSLGVKI
jgi:murein DD-endopeptidase MepM/ murein hydrolase activator NlpD